MSAIEVEAAERVSVAKAKLLVFDFITLDVERWTAPDELFFKMYDRASREHDRATRLYLALRKAAAAQPGFRLTVEETERDGQRSRARSLSVEQMPDETM